MHNSSTAIVNTLRFPFCLLKTCIIGGFLPQMFLNCNVLKFPSCAKALSVAITVNSFSFASPKCGFYINQFVTTCIHPPSALTGKGTQVQYVGGISIAPFQGKLDLINYMCSKTSLSTEDITKFDHRTERRVGE